MQELVDTHCHIQSIGLAAGERTTRELWAKANSLTVDSVLEQAAQHGVTKLICVGCDLTDSQLAIDFVANKPNCFASIGIHPHEAEHYAGQPDKLQTFTQLTHKPKVVAIGECGLDFYYNHSPKAAQTEVLRFQIELALKHQLPIIFHVREAFEDFWPIFDDYKGIRGVLHSFTDSQANLNKAIERGLYIGVNGIATFTKQAEQRAMYAAIPLERLLLETDAPFLTPHPYRGSINEPKRVGVVADFVAGLRDEPRQVVATTTTANAQELFGL